MMTPVPRTQRLTVLLLLNFGIVAALVVVGLAARSLAVFVAGAVYLADAAATGGSLLVIWLAARSRGYSSDTTVATLFNAVWLLMLNIGIAAAAIWQLATGVRHVEGLPVLIVSCIAAVIMPAGALILGGGADDGEENLSVKVVLLDTAADAAVAAGVSASGAFILSAGGWYWLDPATAFGIAVIVGYRALELIRKTAAALRSQ